MSACRHKPTCRVSSHIDLVAATLVGEPTASILCCDREACRSWSQTWVGRAVRIPDDAVVVVPWPAVRR